MLQNAYFLAKIGADTAENERHFAENLPKIGNYPPVVAAAWARADTLVQHVPVRFAPWARLAPGHRAPSVAPARGFLNSEIRRILHSSSCSQSDGAVH